MADPQCTRRGLLAAVGLSALAGCAEIPRQGPVVQVSQHAEAPVAKGVQLRPAPPQSDATPQEVLTGFLDAMASLEEDFTVARQYLTPQAAAAWAPKSGVLVFDGDRAEQQVGESSAAMTAPLIGRLDTAGHFTSVQEVMRHDFEMVKVSGQWRIQHPPSGLLVNRFTLLNRFTQVMLWFLDPKGERVVPEPVWLAASPVSATQLLQALLQGPSVWLAPGVTNALPVDTRMSAPAVVVDEQGIAEVSLSDSITFLPDRQRRQLAAQVMWTLAQVPAVHAVRILRQGQKWNIPGTGEKGHVSLSDLEIFEPVRNAPTTLFAVRGSVVGRLGDNTSFIPLEGVLGRSGVSVEGLAASVSERTVAVVDKSRTRLVIGSTEASETRVAVVSKALGRPQIDQLGRVWVLSSGPTARLHRADDLGSVVIELPLPANHHALEFAISPGGSRVALICEVGGRRVLGMVLLSESGSVASGWRPMMLSDIQGDIVWALDVEWDTPSSIVVLAARDQRSRRSVYRCSLDGAKLEELGPNEDLGLVDLVTRPGATGSDMFVLTQDHTVLRYESAWRWTRVAGDVTEISAG